MKDFEFVIASFPDKEKVVCEINYKGENLAEISQETSTLMLELYSPLDAEYWTFPLDEFQEAIAYAKQHLLSGEDQ